MIGKSRPHVNNTLRLLKLPDRARELLAAGQISAGHARALCNADDPVALAERVATRGLSVRALEEIIKREEDTRAQAVGYARAGRRPKDDGTRALERRLSERTGLAIGIKAGSEGGGEVKLKYDSPEQLDRIVALLGA